MGDFPVLLAWSLSKWRSPVRRYHVLGAVNGGADVCQLVLYPSEQEERPPESVLASRAGAIEMLELLENVGSVLSRLSCWGEGGGGWVSDSGATSWTSTSTPLLNNREYFVCGEPALSHDSHHVSLVQWTNLFASRHKCHRFKSPGGFSCETGILLLALSSYIGDPDVIDHQQGFAPPTVTRPSRRQCDSPT